MAEEQEQIFVVGVDLGGTNVRACLATTSGTILGHCKHPTPAKEGPEAVADTIADCVQRVVADGGTELSRVLGAGVGAPGPLDMNSGVVFQPPNLSGWHNVPLAEMLNERLRIPVKIGNDANLAAIGEHVYGAGQGVKDLVYMTVSTGIGGGVIIGGKLFVGISGTAGEIGHMTIDVHGPRCKCGNIGCVEAIAAGPAIARAGELAAVQNPDSFLAKLARENGGHITTALVAQAAEKSDTQASALMKHAAEAIGAACVNLVNLYNPQRIIIGGGVFLNASDLLLEPILRVVNERALATPREACTVVPAALGDDCGLYGAVALITHAIEVLP
jgi:glucokinase